MFCIKMHTEGGGIDLRVAKSYISFIFHVCSCIFIFQCLFSFFAGIRNCKGPQGPEGAAQSTVSNSCKQCKNIFIKWIIMKIHENAWYVWFRDFWVNFSALCKKKWTNNNFERLRVVLMFWCVCVFDLFLRLGIISECYLD